MTQRAPVGTFANPLELRNGAADFFYAIWARWLATGDVIVSSDWTVADAGATLSNESINTGGTLELGGVTYAQNTVTSVQVEDVAVGDLVELINTVSSQAGRTEVQSVWVRGVKNYSGG